MQKHLRIRNSTFQNSKTAWLNIGLSKTNEVSQVVTITKDKIFGSEYEFDKPYVFHSGDPYKKEKVFDSYSFFDYGLVTLTSENFVSWENSETFSLDKSAQIDKNEIIDKMETGETIYKITNENSNEFSNRDSSNKKNKHKKYEDENDTRAIKPPILSRYSSSTSEEEEEDDEEEKEEEKEIEPAPQEEPKTKKPNRFDELLHAYGTNYVYEIKKINANNDNKYT